MMCIKHLFLWKNLLSFIYVKRSFIFASCKVVKPQYAIRRDIIEC